MFFRHSWEFPFLLHTRRIVLLWTLLPLSARALWTNLLVRKFRLLPSQWPEVVASTSTHLPSLKRAQVDLVSIIKRIESCWHWSMFVCLTLYSALMLFLCDRFWQAWIIVLITEGKFFVIGSPSLKPISYLQLLLVILGWSLDPLDWHSPLLTRVTGCYCLCASVDVNVLLFLRWVVFCFLVRSSSNTSWKGDGACQRRCPCSQLFIPLPMPLVNPFVPPLPGPLPLLPRYHLALSFPLPCALQSIALWPHMPHVLQ